MILSDLATDARLLRRIVWRVDGDVIFLLHALDQLLDQLIKRAVHLHLLKLFAHLVEDVAVHQRLLNRLAQFVERLLAVLQIVEAIVILKSALQKIVGERREQVFHAHLGGGIGNVLGILDALHRGPSVERPPVAKGRLFVTLANTSLSALGLTFSGAEDALLAAPDALVRVESFEDELGGGDLQFGGIFGRHIQGANAVH